MSRCAVIASGASLTDTQISAVRAAKLSGRFDHVVAVSNVGIDKAPWADALVAYDSAWWTAYPEAFAFEGRKFSRQGFRGTEKVDIPFKSCNSGLLAMLVARDEYAATSLVLLGFDMRGQHYFGRHTAQAFGRELRNTDERLFTKHREEFKRFTGAHVVNCTPGTALTVFPIKPLSEVL